MNKLLIILTLFIPLKSISQSLIAKSILPTELKMMVECSPKFESNSSAKSFIDDFNATMNSINPTSLKVFSKSEIYKFILNFEGVSVESKSKKDFKARMKNLMSKRRRLCKFEQWILYGIRTDKEKIKNSKKIGYKRKLESYSEIWMSFMEYIINKRDYSVRNRYLDFLRSFTNKARIFSLTGEKNEKTFLTLNKAFVPNDNATKEKEIDKLFKEKANKDN